VAAAFWHRSEDRFPAQDSKAVLAGLGVLALTRPVRLAQSRMAPPKLALWRMPRMARSRPALPAQCPIVQAVLAWPIRRVPAAPEGMAKHHRETRGSATANHR
jgi:hypothetical protein